MTKRSHKTDALVSNFVIGFDPFRYLDRLVAVLAAVRDRIAEDDKNRPKKRVRSQGILERSEFWKIFRHSFEDIFPQYHGNQYVAALGTIVLGDDEDGPDALLVKIRYPSGYMRGFRMGRGGLRILEEADPESNLRVIFEDEKYTERWKKHMRKNQPDGYVKKVVFPDLNLPENAAMLYEIVKRSAEAGPIVSKKNMTEIFTDVCGLKGIRPAEIGRYVIKSIAVEEDSPEAILVIVRGPDKLIRGYRLGERGKAILESPLPSPVKEPEPEQPASEPEITKKIELATAVDPVSVVNQLANAIIAAQNAKVDIETMRYMKQNYMVSLGEICDPARRNQITAAIELLNEIIDREIEVCSEQIYQAQTQDMDAQLAEIRRMIANL